MTWLLEKLNQAGNGEDTIKMKKHCVFREIYEDVKKKENMSRGKKMKRKMKRKSRKEKVGRGIGLIGKK